MLKTFFALSLFLSLSIFGYFYFKKATNDPQSTAVTASKNILVKKELPSFSVDYLKSLQFDSAAPVIEQELSSGSNYKRYIASYTSEGNKIFGLLTIPSATAPAGGYPAIVFIHGYIPPNQYVTTEKYIAYVDSLARSNFVVFKIDLRGHGKSEGVPTGSYFSSGYTIDILNAVKSLQKSSDINSTKIGLWGHSMSGNAVLRSMLVDSSVKAGVIWAGAVYSYEDFAKYRLNDNSYVRQPSAPRPTVSDPRGSSSPEVRQLRENSTSVNFSDDFWSAVSLTKNINYLNAPLQIHHSVNDDVVNIGYSRDLADVLKTANKNYEMYEYTGGGHNIESPYFEQAMKRTIDFYKQHLN